MKVFLTLIKVGATLAFLAFCLVGLPMWVYSQITGTKPVDYIPNYQGEVAIETTGYFSPFEIIGIAGFLVYVGLLVLVFAWAPAKDLASKVWAKYYWNYDNVPQWPPYESSTEARREGMTQGERFFNTTTGRIEYVV